MEGAYYDNSRREGLPLGEDAPAAGGPGVADRGLFGGHHGHGSYAGGEGRPPMPYDGGYGERPPAEGGYDGAPPAYESGGYDDRGLFHGRHHDHNMKHGDDLDEERRHKQYAEAAAAAAVGYGLYEHHQKKEAEDKAEENRRPYDY